MRLLVVIIFVGVCAVTAGAVWFAMPHLPEYVEQRRAVFNDRHVEFLVVDVSASDWQWALMNTPNEPKSVAKWRESTSADLVINAAYFGEDFSPSGYFSLGDVASAVPWPTVDEQKEKGSYSFLVSVGNDGVELAYLPNAPQGVPTNNAFLSFPTLVVQGEPIVEENSYRAAARTMLAQDAAGHDYIILTQKGNVTLYEAAQWLAEQPEDFVIAGNLDGGPSTGISLENGMFDVERASAPVPSALLLRRKE